MDYNKIFAEIYTELEKIPDTGKIASYIPELGNVDPNKFGVHLTTTDNQDYSFGDANEKFSIQSIAKVLALILAYDLEGEKLWDRVGVEPSGTSFNSLVQLESDLGIPRNPFINAGALVISDVLVGHLKNPKTDFINFVRKVANDPTIDYSSRIADSEKSTGYRNAALANFMKSFNNIHNEIDVVLDFYFHMCSIEMTCKELSRTFLFMAKKGVNTHNNEAILSAAKSKRINSIMQLCGFYDEAGEFAFKVGLPGKSGVGGGIIAIYPGKYSIAVWSPKLNKKGNSSRGIKFLEMLTTEV
ncbi:MAG: glutaminase [Vicingus serpentipes]|nr:glutaminase [Vicingus serpentipes]